MSFSKVDPSEYSDLFKRMRLNQVPEHDLNLDIRFDDGVAVITGTAADDDAIDSGVCSDLRPGVDDVERVVGPVAERLPVVLVEVTIEDSPPGSGITRFPGQFDARKAAVEAHALDEFESSISGTARRIG